MPMTHSFLKNFYTSVKNVKIVSYFGTINTYLCGLVARDEGTCKNYAILPVKFTHWHTS